MTPSRYLFARVAQSFGISRRSQRLSEAAFETHLLREAEQILGIEVWPQTEQVEELAVEYWNLRKMRREREELVDKLAAAETTLAQAHEERAELLNQTTEAQQELEQRRLQLLKELEEIARDRDQVVAYAKEVRRIYEGLKMKIAVLGEESGDHVAPETEKAKSRMRELRGDFEVLKQRRAEVGQRLEEGDARLREIEAQLGERRRVRREEAAKTFQIIGQSNRDISNYRAQIGLIETREQQLYGEIGRYVSRHARTNPQLAGIYRARQPLIDIMAALRRSIVMNRRLTYQY
jgi:chromosome segregation ATPase